MGPRSFERGESAGLAREPEGADASMGPLSFERGEFKHSRNLNDYAMLQWGHVHSNVESSSIQGI